MPGQGGRTAGSCHRQEEEYAIGPEVQGRKLGAVRIICWTLVAVSAPCAACAGGDANLSSHVAQLRAEQQQRQADLNRIEEDIRKAKAEQMRQQCHAFVAQLQSEVAVQKAECLANRAEYGKCLADASAKATKGGFFGCLVGLGAAVLTGGAAAPMAAAGCAVGYGAGKASTSACGESPVCTPDDAVLGQGVLTKYNLPGWPDCDHIPWH